MSFVSSLRGKILVASVTLALALGLAFAALVVSIRSSRDAAETAERSERVASGANRLERLLLDLETGQRAYVITGNRAFLAPWDRALRAYPAQVDELRRLVADPAQRRRVDGIGAAMNDYVDDWSQPVVVLVPVDRAAAAARVATGGGKRRVDALRARFDTFLARQRQLTAEHADAADTTTSEAVLLGLAGLAGTVLLVFLFATYLIRSTIVPVENVADAARRLRGGDRAARTPERAGRDEAAGLTRDFNAMATGLSDAFEDLGRQRAELAAVLDAATEGIAMTDLSGELVFTNERMDAIWRELGVAEKGSIWNRLAGLAELTGRSEEYFPAFALLAADPEAVVEEGFEVPSLERSFNGYTAPVRDPDGVVLGRIFSLRETTRERAAERAKEEFVATVSHELRTPLTSIRGYLELVRDGEAGELTREQDRFLAIVDRSAEQLHGLVDDLLTVGRAATAGLALELGDVELAALLDECIESARAEAAERRITLRLEAEPGLHVRGDRRRLVQLGSNLIGNAIKFTPMGGSVEIRARRSGDAAVLEVADTGIGIPPAELDRLFDRFFRASSASAAQVSGTGLGLAICKEIAEAHGGTISVQSAEGAGTTFRVELPVGGPE